MNILYFAPAATPDNPSMCPFITQRVFELQKLGHKVVVLQYGNLFIKNPFETKRRGVFKIAAVFYKCVKLLCHGFENQKKKFSSDCRTFEYFDSVSFFSYKSFYKWYKKNKFDIIHAHFLWFSKQLPLLKKQFGIPYVITVHGSDMHELTPYDLKGICEMKNILENSNKCIFVSKFLLNHARSLGFSGNNCEIIYNGIDFENFYPRIKNESNNSEPLLGFVGHPNFIKRPDILPMVLKLVQEKFPKAKLLLVGSENGDLLPYIKYQVWKLGLEQSIDFIPAVPPEQVAEYMQKMSVLLFPSRNDGFGCVAIEAQACGIGVVASANGGIPEAVGANGICVPESENFISDYADAVVRWLRQDHDSKKIAESVKDYSWENCVKKEIYIYSTILMSRGGGPANLHTAFYAGSL